MIRALLLAWPLLAQSDVEHFEAKVRPVLVRSCQPCHGHAQQFGKLRMDSRAGLLEGGTRGPAIVPGKANQSLLVQSIRHEGALKMPQGGRLSNAEIEAIATWIDKGAVWPAATGAPRQTSIDDHYRRLVRGHWAFQPVKAAPARDVDSFIRARLAKDQLTLAKPAERRILIRRLSYVLTGLPPRLEDVEQFVNDRSPNAYENLVDRLLAAPQYGEHWARHWLDVVRYGETRGYEWNYEILGAWRYRDYLIRAFNADVGYDQLIREHLAGDLLAKPRINAREQLNESVIGTAFYRLGEAGHDDCIQFRELATDVIDNQIDTLTKTFQGLTVSCARCHNHKLDPIPTDDYYALYGVLNSSHHVTQSIDAPQANAEPIAKLRGIKEQVRKELAAQWLRELPAGLEKALAEKSHTALESPSTLFHALEKEPWDALRARYQKEAASRAEFNRTKFQLLPLTEWRASGMGLRDGVSPPGSFAVAVEGDAVVSGIYPEGIYTHLDSTRLNGAIRFPQLPVGKKNVSFLAMGGMLGSHRTVVDNCAIGEGYKLLDSDKFAWQKTALKKTQLPVYPELMTRFDNPRIPDRPGVIKTEQLPLMNTPRSWFGISQAVVHDTEEAPRAGLSHLLRIFDGEPIADARQLRARYLAIAKTSVERWAQGAASDDDVRWIEWLLQGGALANNRQANARLTALTNEYRQVEAQLAEPRVVEGLADIAPGHDFPILLSGSALNPGAPAKRSFLRYLNGDAPLTTVGSGRKELAERIADPANPLTARVMVNRIWHHVFGRGLVTSIDNFGILADRPSHPELLDALAARFISDGWSIRKMVRLLVMSETFRQAGETTARARELDPQNALLHHYSLRRLTAESLRDSILSSAGTLKLDLYGPSISPFRDKPQDYRRLFSGPLDGEGRRSIYLKVTRMEGARFLETFDYPSPMATRGARDITNVPAQALTLMNDPFLITQSSQLAARVLAQQASTFEDRLNHLFRFTLGRAPNSTERERFLGLSNELASLLGKPRDGVEVWSQLAHATFNLKEFLYIQ